MRYLLLLLTSLLAKVSCGQFSTASTGLTVLSGTTFSYEGMAFVPGSNLTISNNVLERTATPASNGSVQGITRVYGFTNPVNFTGDITIRYESGELNGNVESMMQVAYSDLAAGNTWTISTGSTIGTAGTYTVSNSFTGINLARVSAFGQSSTLPIVLQKFEGKAATEGNLLSWVTSLEANVQEIQLERSENAISYTRIAGFAANGTGSSYSYTDKDAVGKQFYRLKIIDRNGHLSYSRVIQLERNAGAFYFQLAPNPVYSQLKITASITEGQLSIHNAHGQKMLQQLWKQGQTVDLSQLPAGTYVVTLIGGQQSFTGKVVKQ